MLYICALGDDLLCTSVTGFKFFFLFSLGNGEHAKTIPRIMLVSLLHKEAYVDQLSRFVLHWAVQN